MMRGWKGRNCIVLNVSLESYTELELLVNYERGFRELRKLQRAFVAKSTSYLDTPYSTIDYLRKLAELNFAPECYQRYLEMIEPGIKSIIPNYLKDWQNVEGYVTMIMMRRMGLFKTRYSVTSIDDGTEEKYSDMCDVAEFKKVKKWNFKEKIDYLKKEGIFKENSYKLLDTLREKRNKIHEMGAVFSDRDLQDFSKAYSIVFYIHTTYESDNLPEEERNRIREMAEKWAEEAFKFVKM